VLSNPKVGPFACSPPKYRGGATAAVPAAKILLSIFNRSHFSNLFIYYFLVEYHSKFKWASTIPAD
jgi:hypothetical protein